MTASDTIYSDRKFRLWPFLVSLVITLAIGVVASLFTRPEIPGWYRFLHKPSFNPPDWLFPLVWTILYVLIAIAAYRVWVRRNKPGGFGTTCGIYFIQLALNFSWSIVFFGMHLIATALVVIMLLWISIIFNIIRFAQYDSLAAWLLVPYLLWVSFATVLNYAIYRLN